MGGVVTPAGEIAFPNATYHIPQADLDFWLSLPTDSPDDFANFFASVAQQKLPVITGQIEPLSGEVEIAPGITAIPAPGHTPGHYAVLLSSDGERLLNLADVALHHIIGLERPGWHLGLEVDPVEAEATRLALLEQASEERFKIFGYHFPFPGIGYAVRDQGEEAPEARWKFVVTG
jgi:glyoxylase-like metal-dependent hydrolase (beta-lactamase superfamily II)